MTVAQRVGWVVALVVLSPVIVLVGPAFIFVTCLHALLAGDWFPHPGESVAAVVFPVWWYVVGGAFVHAVWVGQPWQTLLYLLAGGTAVALVASWWAWMDYRRRSR